MPTFCDLPDNAIDTIGTHLELRSRTAFARSATHHWKVLKPSVVPLVNTAVDAARGVSKVLERIGMINGEVEGMLDAIVLHPDLQFDIFDGDNQIEFSGVREYIYEHLPDHIRTAFDTVYAERVQDPDTEPIIDVTIQLTRVVGDYSVTATWQSDPRVTVFTVKDGETNVLEFVWSVDVASDEGKFISLDVGENLDPKNITMLSVLYDDHLRTVFNGLDVFAPLRAPQTPYDRVHEYDLRNAFHPQGVPV